MIYALGKHYIMYLKRFPTINQESFSYLEEVKEGDTLGFQLLFSGKEKEGSDSSVNQIHVLRFPGESDQIQSLPPAVSASEQSLTRLI